MTIKPLEEIIEIGIDVKTSNVQDGKMIAAAIHAAGDEISKVLAVGLDKIAHAIREASKSPNILKKQGILFQVSSS